MIDKDSIKHRRDGAIFATLGIEAKDRIVAMIPRRDGLYAISLDKTIRVNLPNDLDPEMEHDDAPIAQTLVASKGSRNPIIARTILQAEDFLRFIPNEERQRRVRDIAWEVMTSLLAISSQITGLRSAIDSKRDEILPDYSLYALGPSPPPAPIVESLEIDFRSVVLLANHTLNSISELFPVFFEQDFKRGKFDRIPRWASRTFGEADPLSRMLRADEIWINAWGEVRNAFEHPKENYFVRVNNFRLLANREIQLPTWQLRNDKLDLFRPQALIDTLGLLEQNILGLFENLLVALTEKVLVSSLAIGLIDKGEDDRDPDCPKRYELVSVLQPNDIEA
ncbi:hypothetical protein ABID59_000616 [Bradyrhizobium sp. S3.3.6]|uniref:hypothetical protein n=1 Tax=Bradyrhizobium sp. S3.3.6 TaxID=3156429 RepID=UPI00339459BB